MSGAEGRSVYESALAFLRARLLGAVSMPALIGIAFTARRGELSWGSALLLFLGLGSAELLDLLGSDYLAFLAPEREKIARLPGNPVIRPSLLDPARLPLILIPVGLVALAVLLYFTFAAGLEVLLLVAAAGIISVLYLLSPFPYAFLSTALLPPLISGGTYLALTGTAAAVAFLAGAPVAWISLGVILVYRVLYASTGSKYRRTRRLLVVVFALSGFNIAVFVPLGIYPPLVLTALFPVVLLLILFARLTRSLKSDPIPATAAGVFMHTLASLLIALSLLIG
jgi:hypothetical protein